MRVSDDFYDHPKFLAAGLTGVALWLVALAWCNRNHTDGHIPATAVRRLLDLDGADDVTERLVACGLWERTESGFHFHDYEDYQLTNGQATERSAAFSAVRAEAGRKGAAARWGNRDASPMATHGKPMASPWQADDKPMANRWPQPQTPGVKNNPPFTPPDGKLMANAIPATNSGVIATQQRNGVNLDELERITGRLIRLCTAHSRERVKLEAVAVTTWAMCALDLRVVDEEIGLAEVAATRPALPRFLVKPLERRAATARVSLPKFVLP